MKPFNLVVLFAPLVLTLADVVDSAPSGVAGVARDISAHRRAAGDVPSSPWHRRYSDNARRQENPAAADPTSTSGAPVTPPEVPIEGNPDPAPNVNVGNSEPSNSGPTDPEGTYHSVYFLYFLYFLSSLSFLLFLLSDCRRDMRDAGPSVHTLIVFSSRVSNRLSLEWRIYGREASSRQLVSQPC